MCLTPTHCVPAASGVLQLPAPAAFPLSIGVLGDPGQTYNSSDTLTRLIDSDPQLLILLGDFAYADNWFNASHQVTRQQWGTLTCEQQPVAC
jgi:hypothetical protein